MTLLNDGKISEKVHFFYYKIVNLSALTENLVGNRPYHQVHNIRDLTSY